MFARRIWEFDFTAPQARAALRSGWTRADILWESMMEAGCDAFAAGDTARAAREFRRAWWTSRIFARTDLRRAATGAALGVACGSPRRIAGARRALAAHADSQIARTQIGPRARSSLFHLRMEARHREAYHGNLRRRMSAIARETVECLGAMERGLAPPHRLHSRWKGERPAVHDGTRMTLAALLLIPEPPGREPSAASG